MRPVDALVLLVGLLFCGQAAGRSAVARRGLRGDPSTSEREKATVKERMEATPAYVISGVEERWQHARHVLSALHISAERVWPPKPSLHLTEEMYAIHDYDKNLNVSDPVRQKYFSLLWAWKHALHHLAHHPDLEPHDWGVVVEDDISLHGNVTLAAAQAGILHGFELARSDGWLYLGVCPRTWFTETEQVYQGLTFAKFSGVCSHAVAFTKHRAATIMNVMHTSMKEDFVAIRGSYQFGESIDQLFDQYGHGLNGIWTVGSNLEESENAVGLLYQDRDRFVSTIDT